MYVSQLLDNVDLPSLDGVSVYRRTLFPGRPTREFTFTQEGFCRPLAMIISGYSIHTCDWWLRVFNKPAGDWTDYHLDIGPIPENGGLFSISDAQVECISQFMLEIVETIVLPMVQAKITRKARQETRLLSVDPWGPGNQDNWTFSCINRAVYAGSTNRSDFLRWSEGVYLGWSFSWTACYLGSNASLSFSASHPKHGKWQLADSESLQRLGAAGFVAQFWPEIQKGDLTTLHEVMAPV